LQTTIATHVQSGSFFDLTRADPALVRLREDRAAWTLPFALMEHLLKSGTPYSAHARALRSDTVHVSGLGLDWFEGDLPHQIADDINLGNYEIAEHTEERRATLVQALERLASIHPEGFARVRTFVRGLLWVKLKPGCLGASLTSSSDPVLPYVIVVSDKAQHHIPPNTVSPEPSHVFLAENVLHEAVHQSVSFHIAQRRVFVDGYSSATSPRIEIAWRRQGPVSNQYWEVDRAFHAALVYHQLLRFRRAELGQDDLTAGQRSSLQDAHDESLPALRYLMDQLDLMDEHFTPHGRELLSGLRLRTDEL
jgi:hypothetical protein